MAQNALYVVTPVYPRRSDMPVCVTCAAFGVLIRGVGEESLGDTVSWMLATLASPSSQVCLPPLPPSPPYHCPFPLTCPCHERLTHNMATQSALTRLGIWIAGSGGGRGRRGAQRMRARSIAGCIVRQAVLC